LICFASSSFCSRVSFVEITNGDFISMSFPLGIFKQRAVGSIHFVGTGFNPSKKKNIQQRAVGSIHFVGTGFNPSKKKSIQQRARGSIHFIRTSFNPSKKEKHITNTRWVDTYNYTFVYCNENCKKMNHPYGIFFECLHLSPTD